MGTWYLLELSLSTVRHSRLSPHQIPSLTLKPFNINLSPKRLLCLEKNNSEGENSQHRGIEGSTNDHTSSQCRFSQWAKPTSGFLASMGQQTNGFDHGSSNHFNHSKWWISININAYTNPSCLNKMQVGLSDIARIGILFAPFWTGKPNSFLSGTKWVVSQSKRRCCVKKYL